MNNSIYLFYKFVFKFLVTCVWQFYEILSASKMFQEMYSNAARLLYSPNVFVTDTLHFETSDWKYEDRFGVHQYNVVFWAASIPRLRADEILGSDFCWFNLVLQICKTNIINTHVSAIIDLCSQSLVHLLYFSISFLYNLEKKDVMLQIINIEFSILYLPSVLSPQLVSFTSQ